MLFDYSPKAMLDVSLVMVLPFLLLHFFTFDSTVKINLVNDQHLRRSEGYFSKLFLVKLWFL